MWMQLVRYALLTLAPVVATYGHITRDDWTTGVGLLMALATWAWGIYVKWGTTSVPNETAARPDVPTVDAATGAVKL